MSSDYRNLSVKLAVTRPKTTSGEQSTLAVTVGGLRGLTAPVPLVLDNRSPDIVRMERGERETIFISPADVQPDGTFTQTRQLTSLRPGAFTVSATVVARVPEGPPRSQGAQSAARAPRVGESLPPNRDRHKDGPQDTVYKVHVECGEKKTDMTVDTDSKLDTGRLVDWLMWNCDSHKGTVVINYTEVKPG